MSLNCLRRRIIKRALGCEKGGEDVVTFVGKGGKGYEHYLMVELDQNVDLGACDVDTDILVRPFSASST
jgi:hypothetical protein